MADRESSRSLPSGRSSKVGLSPTSDAHISSDTIISWQAARSIVHYTAITMPDHARHQGLEKVQKEASCSRPAG